MGEKVGRVVGGEVGAACGRAVGPREPEMREGGAVWSGDGLTVGTALGLADGVRDGLCVGVWLGLTDGSGDGTTVDTLTGESEIELGEALGADLNGDNVGNAEKGISEEAGVGTSVGDDDDPDTGNCVGSLLFDNSIGAEVGVDKSLVGVAEAVGSMTGDAVGTFVVVVVVGVVVGCELYGAVGPAVDEGLGDRKFDSVGRTEGAMDGAIVTTLDKDGSDVGFSVDVVGA